MFLLLADSALGDHARRTKEAMIGVGDELRFPRTFGSRRTFEEAEWVSGIAPQTGLSSSERLLVLPAACSTGVNSRSARCGAKARGVVRSAEHLAMRQARSRPLMENLHAWLLERDGLHPPKSLMGSAVRYALNNWTELTRFLDDARIPLDKNRSEAALRIAALGRKNFLFVGNEQAGKNIAGVYALVATCEANGVNPLEYLRDVLLRIAQPGSALDELLPHRWARPL